MPELPEVETTGRGIAAKLLGQRIVKLEQRRTTLRRPMPLGLPNLLEGRKLIAVERRAKYLLLRLDDGFSILLHLGMSGRIVISETDDGTRNKHDHVVFTFGNGAVMRFNDARRFGLLDLVKTGEEHTHKLLLHIGPEPLDKIFTGKVLAERVKGKKAAIKLALLDQTILAGIGNIYACEALFDAGIDPRKEAGKVSREKLDLLVPAIKKVLKAALKDGGSSLRDYRQASGELGYFQTRFAVYDREGQPCGRCVKCKGVQRFTQSGRSTFWCPQQQR